MIKVRKVGKVKILTFVTCNKCSRELNTKNDEKLISPIFRFINDGINEKTIFKQKPE